MLGKKWGAAVVSSHLKVRVDRCEYAEAQKISHGSAIARVRESGLS